MAIIGSAYVEVRALDTNLRRDIDNAMKKIKDVTINLQVDVNLTPVRKKISQLRAEIRNNPLKFQAEVESQKIVDTLAEAHQLYEDNPLRVESTTDTAQMEASLQAVRERFRVLQSDVTPEAHTARAEAQVAALTRRRHLNVTPILQDASIKKALKGLTYTLMGAVPADKVKAILAGVAGNFEAIAVSGAKILTLIGSIGSMALTSGANLLSFGADAGRMIGVLAMGPAVLTTFGVAIAALKMGFKGFGAAFSSDAKKAAEALKKLPKEAQVAVKAMRGLGTEIRKNSQNAFWKEMGTSLQDTVKTIFPAVKRGMAGASVATAKFTKGVLASFKEMAESGGMDTLFKNINTGLTNLSKGAKPFFDAMNTLAVSGSKHLGGMGTSVANLATRFDNWIKKAEKAGDIDRWIRTATQNFKDLGTVISGTTGIFQGLSRASNMSGAKGLREFAGWLKDMSATVNSEPFTSKLVSVLKGARKGTEALGDGFKDITKVISEGTGTLAGFLTVAGQIGGSVFSSFAKMFDGTGLGTGLMHALWGAKDAIDLMAPAFSNLGGVIGDLGEIAGVLFVNMAPGINNLAITLEGVIGGLRQGVMDVIPVFNVFIQNVLMVISPIVIGAAEAIGKFLTFFANLPSIVTTAILALGLFLLLLRKFRGPLDTLGGQLQGVRDKIRNTFAPTQAVTKMRDAFATTAVAAGYAKEAIGKSFSGIRDSARITGMYISDGFKKSLTGLNGHVKTHVLAPMATLGRELKGLFKEALLPPDVRKGFAGVGSKLMEVARIYTGYFGAAKDSITNAAKAVGSAVPAMGRAVASAFPIGQLVPALKALPGEVGKAFGWAGQKVATGVAGMAKIIAGPAVGYAMGKMREVISTQALYASKHLSDIGKGMQTAASAVKTGAATIGSTVSKAFSAIPLATAKAFNSAVLAAAVHPMTAPFVKMADAAKTASDKAANSVKTMAKTVGTAINTATVPARAAFAGMAVAASIQSGIMAHKFKVASTEIGGRISTAFKEAGRDLATVGRNTHTVFSKAFQGIGTAATTAANTVKTTMGKAATTLKTNFAPAADAMRQTFSGMSGLVRPAATAVGELATAAGRAAKSVGQSAAGGLVKAADGLSSVLGGPWGLALAGATAAVSAFADAQAKSKARVEALSATLDQQTGAMTNASKVKMTEGLFDGVTDDWDNFVRGVFQNSKTVNETLDALDINTKQYTDTMMDSKGREALVSGMGEVAFALKHGREVTDEMADAIGMSKTALDGLDFEDKQKLGDSLEHARTKAIGMGKEFDRAQEKVQNLAKATGVNSAEAAILQRNYDVLANSTSTAADKFTALKTNLELLSTATEKSQLGQKGYHQGLRDTKAQLEEVKKANGGLVTNLFDVKKGFDFTKQAGADLHTALSGQVDGIARLGSEAVNKAVAEGKKGEEVTRAALDAMAPGIAALQARLKDLGFAPGQISAIVESFNLLPKDIQMAISAPGAENARREIALTALAASAYAQGNYKATLAALPDAAKKSIEDATGLAGAFARGDYDAILGALNETDMGADAALARILTVVDGKYDAELKAMDFTNAGVRAANKSIADKFKGKAVNLSADDGVTSVVDVAQKKINSLTGKTVSIVTVYSKRDAGSVGEAGSGRQTENANGSIIKSVTNFSSLLTGAFRGKVRSFANGGVEKHVAQISRGQTPYRVWSEPETGGEAYIPLSKAKRPRSLKILEEVARMFGMSLLNMKTMSFANGGTTGASSSSSASSSMPSSSGNVPAALLSSISKSLLKDSGGLNTIGLNIVQGIVGGVNTNRRTAVVAMKNLSNDLEGTVREELDIHSPSKAFLSLGKYIVDGLAIGIKTTAGTALKNMATLSNRLFVAARDVAKATGRSVTSSINLINSQRKLNVAWSKMAPAKYTDQIVDYYQKTGRTGNRTLADIVRARDDVVFRLNAANTRLKTQTAAHAEVVKDVASRMKGEFKLGSNILSETDPYVPEMRFSDVKTYATGVLGRLRTFNTKLQQLRKKGVSAALIQEVASLGSVEGTAMADALLSGSSADIKGINSDVAAIASISTSIGVSTADGMYKAGIDGTRGLVNGLLKDQKSLSQAATKISNTLIGTVKKNLGIRSPSRVFAEMGRYTTEGYIVGLDQMQPTLDRRMDTLINVTPRRPAAVSLNGSSSSSETQTALGATPSDQVVIQVLPSAGMDEVAIGKAAVRELNWQMLSR